MPAATRSLKKMTLSGNGELLATATPNKIAKTVGTEQKIFSAAFCTALKETWIWREAAIKEGLQRQRQGLQATARSGVCRVNAH